MTKVKLKEVTKELNQQAGLMLAEVERVNVMLICCCSLCVNRKHNFCARKTNSRNGSVGTAANSLATTYKGLDNA